MKLTAEEKVMRTDDAMDRLAELVTKHGPKFLVRGMPAYQAHEAMVACIEWLVELKEANADALTAHVRTHNRYRAALEKAHPVICNDDVDDRCFICDALEGK